MRGGLHRAAIRATSAAARRGRSPLDRAMARFPGLVGPVTAWILSRPTSRWRDGLVRRFVARAYEAYNRRDWEVNTIFFHPERFEFRPGNLANNIPGGREVYYGTEGYLQATGEFLEVWNTMRVRLGEIWILGPNRLATTIYFEGEGQGSGMRLSEQVLVDYDLEDGLVVTQTFWFDLAAGYRSIGLQPPSAAAIR